MLSQIVFFTRCVKWFLETAKAELTSEKALFSEPAILRSPLFARRVSARQPTGKSLSKFPDQKSDGIEAGVPE
jgi:hypothetical protein